MKSTAYLVQIVPPMSTKYILDDIHIRIYASRESAEKYILKTMKEYGYDHNSLDHLVQELIEHDWSNNIVPEFRIDEFLIRE